jgi:hypothetical protein
MCVALTRLLRDCALRAINSASRLRVRAESLTKRHRADGDSAAVARGNCRIYRGEIRNFTMRSAQYFAVCFSLRESCPLCGTSAEVTYVKLPKRLKMHGSKEETEASMPNKLKRRTFAAT